VSSFLPLKPPTIIHHPCTHHPQTLVTGQLQRPKNVTEQSRRSPLFHVSHPQTKCIFSFQPPRSIRHPYTYHQKMSVTDQLQRPTPTSHIHKLKYISSPRPSIASCNYRKQSPARGVSAPTAQLSLIPDVIHFGCKGCGSCSS